MQVLCQNRGKMKDEESVNSNPSWAETSRNHMECMFMEVLNFQGFSWMIPLLQLKNTVLLWKYQQGRRQLNHER